MSPEPGTTPQPDLPRSPARPDCARAVAGSAPLRTDDELVVTNRLITDGELAGIDGGFGCRFVGADLTASRVWGSARYHGGRRRTG